MQQPRNISNFRRSLVSSVRTGANNVFFTGHNDTLYSCIPEQQTRERGVQYLRLGYTYGYYVLVASLPPKYNLCRFSLSVSFRNDVFSKAGQLAWRLAPLHCAPSHRFLGSKQATNNRSALLGRRVANNTAEEAKIRSVPPR